jgi:2-polyprenyl-6-methoxyphenol hydroxylase-like FAD-dependent oxidoreductase
MGQVAGENRDVEGIFDRSSVAVVGGGPAGVTAARALAALGHRVVLHGAAVVLAPFTRTTPDAFWLRTMLSPLDRTIESVPPLNVHDEIASADGASTIARAWNVISAPAATRATERRPRLSPRARKLIRCFLLELPLTPCCPEAPTGVK